MPPPVIMAVLMRPIAGDGRWGWWLVDGGVGKFFVVEFLLKAGRLWDAM